MATICTYSQAIQGFETSPFTGYTFSNMNVSTSDVICGSKSLHSTSAFKSNSIFSITTPASTMSGPIAINFAYRIQLNNSHKNWTMKVKLYKTGQFTAVYSSTYTNNGNVSSPGCGHYNFNSTTTSQPLGSYYLYIEFTTESTDNDQNNKIVIDNIQAASCSSLPVTFVGFPAVQRVDDQYVKVIFSVADQSNISVYNVQFSEDLGKTWKTVALVMPDNAVSGKTYTVNVKFPKTK